MSQGLLVNEIPESLIASKTCVATGTRGVSEEFLSENYIWVGSLRVAGKFLATEDNRTVLFEVTIPTKYCLITENGAASGRLDGKNYEGPIQLQAGRHEYGGANGESVVALVWAQAIERGFKPMWTEEILKRK